MPPADARRLRVALLEARQLLMQGRRAEAETSLSRLAPQLGTDAGLRAEQEHLRAIAALMGQRPEAAVASARAAVNLAPERADCQMTLGRAFKANQRIDEAIGAYRQAIALQPGLAEAHVSLGIALRLLGDLDGAIACHRQAIALQPDLAVAHANLGNVLALRQQRDDDPDRSPTHSADAEAAQRAAIRIDPGRAAAHGNLGVTLMQNRRYREAAECFNSALSLDASDEASCLHLGHCLRQLGAFDLARAAYEKWLATNPPRAEVMSALSALLNDEGESELALDWAQKAHALAPDALSLQRIAGALSQLRRLPEAVASFRESLDHIGRHPAFFGAYLMVALYLEDDPRVLDAMADDYGSRLSCAPRPPLRPRSPGERLRVGYLSGDFRRHSVAYFIEPLLSAHDTSRFEVFCYHNAAAEDDVTARLKAIGHSWVDCAEMSDGELLERMRSDRLDVLVDLSGHTAQSRLPLLARRPAPVQIGHLGYPTRTGMPALDFRLTDAVIDPVMAPQPHGASTSATGLESEQPLRLPRTMFCYRPDAEPPTGEPPLLRNGVVTFGSFNNLAKLSDATLRLWAAVMRELPGSRLWLKTRALSQASNQAALRAFFVAQGIEAHRLLFNPWRPDLDSHLTMYREIDIALDCTPYNGATTTVEALWMGVPVLSLAGRARHARVGASLLQAIGQGAWVAQDEPGFVQIATRLARDVDALTQWRQGARAALRTSPLLDAAHHARAVEALFESAVAQVATKPSPATPADAVQAAGARVASGA